MSFSENLQVIKRNRRRHHPVPEVSVGRMAELRVEALLAERLRNSPYDYFAGLRIPHRGRRREVDFVVTTPDELWVIELKNWSGFVGVDGNRLVQYRSGGRGVVEHGPVLRDLKTKRDALRRFLKSHIDEVPEAWPILVFFDKRVGLDESLMSEDDVDVVRLPQLMSSLPPPPSNPGPIGKLLEAVFGGDDDRKALPAVTDPVRDARDALADLGTWDLLALYGGQIISGDLVDASKNELCDRERFRRLHVDVPRSYLDAFRSELAVAVEATAREGEDEAFEYGFDETLKFHCAGDKKPKEFALRDVVGVSFGYVTR